LRRAAGVIDLWYKNAVVYSIDVETFQDGNGDGIGDFQGLASRLPYLAGIGVTCIWLLPFYPSPDRDDGYDIEDYYGVRPPLGSLGDFVEFMNHAEEHGIRVVVDLVVNHTSDTHPWFQSACRDERSPYRNWYVWSKRKPRTAQQGMVFPGVQKSTWTHHREARAYYFHRFFDFQPDLDVSNPAVRAEIQKIMGFWAQLGVSGFRIDAAPFLIEHKGTGEVMGPEEYAYLSEFRHFLDWRRGDAIMLAEANVPPKHILNFFGNDDRMHMLFNFIGNRQHFLAMAREEAQPIRDAYCELPQLSASAQWANFLRNNDELDLSGLDDEARKLCFAEFAPEPEMQLYGRGIRRRLSPMLKGDRRRIELMNSLMFTLPGTPVLRYGEEIGMGENLELPERDAIRTPMQWSDAPNAGFSTAPPERLIRPVIDSGEYRYQRINVMSQRLEFDSLLNWTERTIRTRKECPEFGWGQAQFLKTSHSNVLAHSCEWQGGTVVAVHNFSRATCTVRIELPDDTQDIIQLYGRHLHEVQRGSSPVLDLDGYDYLWLRLRRQSQS
jgi:maltose alpha-D-glucosyltransferase/alpha-amylase